MGGARPTFSERRFHAWLATEFGSRRAGPLPIGDDTSATPIGGGRVALLTTDALAEGTHFLPGSPPEAIGRAAAAASLSDLAAKGGRPVAMLLDLLLPPTTPESWARRVAKGAASTASAWGAALVGGDTKPSVQRAVIGTFLGIGRSDRLAPRSGARPGDRLAVTGVVGRGGVAARRWRAARPATTPDLLRLLSITPRVREGRRLVRWAHAMLDSSDGLAESARLIAEASGVRVDVDPGRLPLAAEAARIPDPRERETTAFYGGDYELVLALPAEAVGPATRSLRSVGSRLTVVGDVRRGSGAWLVGEGPRRAMPAGGWQPFDSAR